MLPDPKGVPSSSRVGQQPIAPRKKPVASLASQVGKGHPKKNLSKSSLSTEPPDQPSSGTDDVTEDEEEEGAGSDVEPSAARTLVLDGSDEEQEMVVEDFIDSEAVEGKRKGGKRKASKPANVPDDGFIDLDPVDGSKPKKGKNAKGKNPSATKRVPKRDITYEEAEGYLLLILPVLFIFFPYLLTIA